MFLFFFFFFWPFASIRGGHSVSCFSKPSYFQRPSPLHQLPPYLLSLHLKIFSSVSLFSSFSVTPFLSSFFPTYSWSLLMTCPYHLSLPSLIFIPNRSTLTVLLMYSFLILSFSSFHSKPQHFHLCKFHLFHLFLCELHRLKPIHHCWSYH